METVCLGRRLHSREREVGERETRVERGERKEPDTWRPGSQCWWAASMVSTLLMPSKVLKLIYYHTI